MCPQGGISLSRVGWGSWGGHGDTTVGVTRQPPRSERPQGCQNPPLTNITILERGLLAQQKGKANLLYLHPSELEALHKFKTINFWVNSKYFSCTVQISEGWGSQARPPQQPEARVIHRSDRHRAVGHKCPKNIQQMISGRSSEGNSASCSGQLFVLAPGDITALHPSLWQFPTASGQHQGCVWAVGKKPQEHLGASQKQLILSASPEETPQGFPQLPSLEEKRVGGG